MKLYIQTKEMYRLEEQLSKTPRKLRASKRDLDFKAADKLRELMVQHASGRPGPNIVTGQYVASFETSVRHAGRDKAQILGGNSSPQAWRLEYGFFGTDSLGRNYSQPAFPHMRPALYELSEWYRQQASILVQEALG